MMHFGNHGGACCGRKHIYSVNGETSASIRRLMRDSGLLDDGRNKLTEIVVSEENEDLDGLRAEIVEAGFTLVATWDNCSGSQCYMYLHANDVTYFPNGVEAAVNERNVPAAPAPAREPPAPFVVHSTFHNVYQRSGRSEAGWPTLAMARERAPRNGTIDRKNIYSDGTARWVANVA